MTIIIKRLVLLRDALKSNPNANTPENQKTNEALIEALNAAIQILISEHNAFNKKMQWAEMTSRVGLILFIYFCLAEAIYVCYCMTITDPVKATTAQMTEAVIVAALWIVKARL